MNFLKKLKTFHIVEEQNERLKEENSQLKSTIEQNKKTCQNTINKVNKFYKQKLRGCKGKVSTV